MKDHVLQTLIFDTVLPFSVICLLQSCLRLFTGLFTDRCSAGFRLYAVGHVGSVVFRSVARTVGVFEIFFGRRPVGSYNDYRPPFILLQIEPVIGVMHMSW